MFLATARGGGITQLLDQWREGDDAALERLTALIYNELRRLARGYLRAEPSGGTMQATALVHEVYLRSAGLRKIEWESRGQLVDHARKKGRPNEAAAQSEKARTRRPRNPASTPSKCPSRSTRWRPNSR